MIFISGPVAVFPSNTIEFQMFLPFHGHFSNPQWLKIKNNIVKEIKEQEDKNQKYFITKSNGLRYSEKLEIIDAGEEDSATYQLSFGTKKSNKIRTFVDGMFIKNHQLKHLTWYRSKIQFKKVRSFKIYLHLDFLSARSFIIIRKPIRLNFIKYMYGVRILS